MPEDKFIFNETLVKQKFAKLEENINKQAGKRGYNPYKWEFDNVRKLVNRYVKDKERSPELQKAILALPDAPPQYFEPGTIPEEQSESAPVLTPRGLKFPEPR